MRKWQVLLNNSDAPITTPAEQNTDSFGCPFDKLDKDQLLHGAGITFLRKGSREQGIEQVATTASNRGFVVGLSTLPGHTRRIFRQHHTTTHLFMQDALYVRDLAEPYKADLGGPFDFLLAEISPNSLLSIAQEADLGGVTSLHAETASIDPVLANLMRALIPALARPEEASKLFIDQLATAIGTHLVQRYGGRALSSLSRARKLSRSQEMLAKSLLLEKLNGDVSVLEIARACNLSRGYFISAFRETTGMTPYRWLVNERVSLAQNLLRTPEVSLSEVAISCGFADQSHFTRVFSNVVGTTPGNWRRNT